MEILPIIIAFIVGFIVGEGFVLFKLKHNIQRIADTHGIDIDNELEKLEEQQTITVQIHRLEIEQHDDVLYLYDRTNENFVCQADNIDELAKLSKSYKNIKVATVVHNDKVFIFNDGIAEEYTK
jgi:hypothetical protein